MKSIKTIMAAFTLIGSVNAFALSVEQAQLTPGKEILVDVRSNDVISLVLETKSKSQKAVPTYSLVKQWSNFECEHKDTVLVSSKYSAAKNIYTNTWEVQVTWTPGADLSGCIVKVSFPGLEDSRAELFMNY